MRKIILSLCLLLVLCSPALAQETDEIYTATEYSTTSTSYTLLNTHTHTVESLNYLELYNLQFTISHSSGGDRTIYYKVTAQADGGPETTVLESSKSLPSFDFSHTVNESVSFGEIDNYGDSVTVRYYLRTSTVYEARIENMYSRCYVINANPTVELTPVTPDESSIYNGLEYYLEGNLDSYSTTLFVNNNSVWTGSATEGTNTITLPGDLELSTGNHTWYVNTTGSNVVGSTSNETATRSFDLLFYISPDNTTNVQAPPFIHEIDVDLFRQGTYSYDINIYYDEDGGQVAFASTPIVDDRTNNYTRTVSLVDGVYVMSVDSKDSSGNVLDSATSTFEISQTLFLNSTSVAGNVYEQRSGDFLKIGSAKVTIYNDTWSDDYVTSQSGYYQFTNLTPGATYYLTASKDGYADSGINIITVEDGLTTTKNILLQKQDAANYILPHYVEFTVKSLWNTVYPDVTVNVYEGDSATALYTGVTDSSGIVGFELSETIRYRLTAVNPELGINEEMYLYPVATQQNFYVYRSIWDYFTPDDSITQEMELNVQGSEINASHAYVNVTYYDAMTETNNVNISVVEINNDGTQTIIATESFLGSSDIEHSFIIEDYVGNSYLVYFTGNHDTFGDFERSYSVQFTGMKDNFGWSNIWIWIAIGGLMFLAGMFGNADYHSGAIIVVVAGWIMYAMGMFSGFSVVAGLGLASAIAVAAYMSNKAKEEGS